MNYLFVCPLSSLNIRTGFYHFSQLFPHNLKHNHINSRKIEGFPIQLIKNLPEIQETLGRAAAEGIGYPLRYSWASLAAQLVKNLPTMQEI